MSFRARIFVQGVGIYVTSKDRRRLKVLFPDSQQKYLGKAPKLTTREGKKFPVHHAAVQYSSRNLAPNGPDKWKSVKLDGYRLYVDSDSKKKLSFAGGGGLLGVPRLDAAWRR